MKTLFIERRYLKPRICSAHWRHEVYSCSHVSYISLASCQ